MPEWEKCLMSLGDKQHRRKDWITSREIMTITVGFHTSSVSYNRFIEL